MEMTQCRLKSGGACSMGTNSVATTTAKTNDGKDGRYVGGQ